MEHEASISEGEEIEGHNESRVLRIDELHQKLRELKLRKISEVEKPEGWDE